VQRCRFAARSDRLRPACPLGLLLATAAVLLAPVCALLLLPAGNGACSCQSPQPPGDPCTPLAFLDPSHGWLPGGAPLLLGSDCRVEALSSGGLTPQSFAWIVASVGRPPPPGA